MQNPFKLVSQAPNKVQTLFIVIFIFKWTAQYTYGIIIALMLIK